MREGLGDFMHHRFGAGKCNLILGHARANCLADRLATEVCDACAVLDDLNLLSALKHSLTHGFERDIYELCAA